MASRHKVVKLRSKNRHASVSPPLQLESQTLWQLDVVNECLHRGDKTLALPPKAFAVLRYLHEHPGRLVTKQELLDAVWPDIAVTEAVLKNCILKLRQVLGDDAKAPRYIETVHWRGYRFIAPLSTTQPVQSSRLQVPGLQAEDDGQRRGTLNVERGTHLVGRDKELAQLHGWLDKAQSGERQLVFVTGEPGIGKTTVVEAFLSGIRGQRSGNNNPALTDPCSLASVPWIARGQCIEHYGTDEAYLPVLEALGRLCREPGGHQMIALLTQHAPTWLVQMPTLLDARALESLQRKTAGTTRERMLRELTEALEALTVERPLVLWLEDLHWSDASTLEWLAFMARRGERARALIIGSYRPVEMLSDGHPLKQVTYELYAHQLGYELVLSHLTETEVNAYLTLRFPESVLPTRLGLILQQRTGGNPLFLR